MDWTATITAIATSMQNWPAAIITAIATVVIAVSTIVTAIITWTLARENKLLRKAETEPEVVAYLSIHPFHHRFVNFVLANVGRGPARNVSFKFEKAEDFEDRGIALQNSASRKPISFLPQGESMHIFFSAGEQIFNESNEPILQPFDVVVEFEDLKGRHRREKYILDVAQFKGLSMLGSPPETEIADSLKEIAEHFRKFSFRSNRLKVEVMTSWEADRRESDFIKKAEQRLSKTK